MSIGTSPWTFPNHSGSRGHERHPSEHAHWQIAAHGPLGRGRWPVGHSTSVPSDERESQPHVSNTTDCFVAVYEAGKI